MMYKIPLLFFLSLLSISSFAQVGMTVNASKLYYRAGKGGSEIQKVAINNPNDQELEVGISFEDWKYDSLGNNQFFESNTLKTSCVDWIKIQPAAYFVLKPHETKDIDIVVTVPEDVDTSVKVHTGLVYLTQLNPGDAKDDNGAALKVTVRIGIKIYHSFSENNKKMIEITDFKEFKINKQSAQVDALQLIVDNTGESWVNGNVSIELTNTANGKTTKMPAFDFYSLPGDHTYLKPVLPTGLEKGKYNAVAIINYGDKTELKVAELEFEL